MTGILDLDGNPLSNFSFSIVFSGNVLFAVQVDCRPGVSLRSVNSDNVFYFGKFDPMDSWTDLEADGLDLTPFDGIRKIIYLKVETDETSIPREQHSRLYIG